MRPSTDGDGARPRHAPRGLRRGRGLGPRIRGRGLHQADLRAGGPCWSPADAMAGLAGSSLDSGLVGGVGGVACPGVKARPTALGLQLVGAYGRRGGARLSGCGGGSSGSGWFGRASHEFPPLLPALSTL